MKCKHLVFYYNKFGVLSAIPRGVNGSGLGWLAWTQIQTHEVGPGLGRVQVQKENV